MLICRPQPERDDKRGVFVERRNFLKLGAGAALPFFASNAWALDYPARAVQVIVGQAAASSSDITARLVSQYPRSLSAGNSLRSPAPPAT